jgi:hypothetical protein
MLDFFRMYHVQVLGFVGSVVAVLIIEGFVRYFLSHGEKVEEELKAMRPWIGRARNLLIIVFFIGFAWSALRMASQNEIPRKVIDRSGLLDQIDKNRR